MKQGNRVQLDYRCFAFPCLSINQNVMLLQLVSKLSSGRLVGLVADPFNAVRLINLTSLCRRLLNYSLVNPHLLFLNIHVSSPLRIKLSLRLRLHENCRGIPNAITLQKSEGN